MSSITAVENDRTAAIAALERRWTREAQECAVRRDYAAADVRRLRSSLFIEHSLARHGAERLRALFHEQPYMYTPSGTQRRPGGADGACGPQRSLPQWLASRRRRRRQPSWPDISRPEPLPCQ